MCNESDQNNTADTPDKNSEENIIPPKMTEEEKKRRLNEQASEYLMFLDDWKRDCDLQSLFFVIQQYEYPIFFHWVHKTFSAVPQ